MATALQDITECCVCTNEFTDPRVLPCDHTFCQTCIDRIKKGSTIKCPVCNEKHDITRIKPDFKLTKFIDALKEKERAYGHAGKGKDAVCGLCSEESATHWCEDCQQWLGKICAKSHRKIPALQNHKLLSIAIKCQEVKSEFNKEARGIKDAMDQYSGSIRNIQDQVNKLELTQADALEKSDKLRNKAIQDIHNVFNAVDAKIIAFLHAKTQNLEAKRKELTKELDDIEVQWKQLEEMINENSNKIAIEGSVIIDQARSFKEAMGGISIQTEPVFATVSLGRNWNPETVVQVQMYGGNVKATADSWARKINRPISSSRSLLKSKASSPVPDLGGLCNKRFNLKKQANLSNIPSTARIINNELWICENNGTVQVFDMNFKQIKNIENKAWGDVFDVALVSNDVLVVAASKGLYQTTLDGQQIARIQSGDYISAVVYNGKLYTTQQNSSEINLYTYNGKWKTEGTIELPCRGSFTLNVNLDAIYACHFQGNKVYKLSHTGQVLQSFDSSGSGSPGNLILPRLCQAGNDGKLLVADYGNNRLLVLYKDGTWSGVRMEPPVTRPIGAVYAGGKLYVVSRDKNVLYKYV